jgi:hypothetical protein
VIVILPFIKQYSVISIQYSVNGRKGWESFLEQKMAKKVVKKALFSLSLGAGWTKRHGFWLVFCQWAL